MSSGASLVWHTFFFTKYMLIGKIQSDSPSQGSHGGYNLCNHVLCLYQDPFFLSPFTYVFPGTHSVEQSQT